MSGRRRSLPASLQKMSAAELAELDALTPAEQLEAMASLEPSGGDGGDYDYQMGNETRREWGHRRSLQEIAREAGLTPMKKSPRAAESKRRR